MKDGNFCGNCDGHNCYDYPAKIFCSTRYEAGLDPVVETLWCCDSYSPVNQNCYCVREAQAAKRTTRKQR